MVNPYLSVAVTTNPTHGTATASGTTISYTPAPGYTGPDSLQYTATNPGGTSVPATISITVTAPAAPGAGNASATATYNTAKVIDLSTAISGSVQAINIITAPTNGTAVVGTGANALKVTYTPGNNYVGPDSFTYQAVGYPSTNVSPTNGTVSLTVAAPGTPVTVPVGPVAIGYNSGAVAIPLAGAVSGSTPITLTISSAMHGTVTLSGTTASYTPNNLYYGSDSFTFYGTNPGGAGNTSTVSLTVANPPAPTVAAKTLSVGYNSSNMLDLTSAVSGVFTPPLAIGTGAGTRHGSLCRQCGDLYINAWLLRLRHLHLCCNRPRRCIDPGYRDSNGGNAKCAGGSCGIARRAIQHGSHYRPEPYRDRRVRQHGNRSTASTWRSDSGWQRRDLHANQPLLRLGQFHLHRNRTRRHLGRWYCDSDGCPTGCSPPYQGRAATCPTTRP